MLAPILSISLLAVCPPLAPSDEPPLVLEVDQGPLHGTVPLHLSVAESLHWDALRVFIDQAVEGALIAELRSTFPGLTQVRTFGTPHARRDLTLEWASNALENAAPMYADGPHTLIAQAVEDGSVVASFEVGVVLDNVTRIAFCVGSAYHLQPAISGFVDELQTSDPDRIFEFLLWTFFEDVAFVGQTTDATELVSMILALPEDSLVCDFFLPPMAQATCVAEALSQLEPGAEMICSIKRSASEPEDVVIATRRELLAKQVRLSDDSVCFNLYGVPPSGGGYGLGNPSEIETYALDITHPDAVLRANIGGLAFFTLPFDVDSTVDSLRIQLFDAGNPTAAFVRPGGSTLQETDPGVRLLHDTFVIDDPEPGTWSFEADAFFGGTMHLSVSARSAIHVDIEHAFSERVGVFTLARGETPVRVRLQGDVDLTAGITGVLRKKAFGVPGPTGDSTAFPLFDDGLHGDGAAGDGLFGGTLTWGDREGDYFLGVRGFTSSGDPWQRFDRQSIQLVCPGPTPFCGLVLERYDWFDEDDLGPLENGDIPVFFEDFTLTTSGPNFGAAVFDSTPAGPNANAEDQDLLVGLGNLLILQENDQHVSPDRFAMPDDAAAGGAFHFVFQNGVRPISITLVDICPVPGQFAVVTLYDSQRRTRVFQVPSGWTTDVAVEGFGFGELALDRTTIQPGALETVSVTEQEGFDFSGVLALDVVLSSSGAIDNLVTLRPE